MTVRTRRLPALLPIALRITMAATALAAAAVVPVAATPPAPAAAATTTTSPDGGPRLRLTLTGLAPAVLSPGDGLTVTGTVVNEGPEPLGPLTVRLRLAPQPLVGRQQLAAWNSADADDPAGLPIIDASTTLDDPLAPARSRGFAVVAPPGTLGLGGAPGSFGPRGLAVEVLAPVDGLLSQLALSRTTIVWYPGRAFLPVKLSLLVPITSDQPSNSLAMGPELTDAMRVDGRLDRVLRAADDPSTAWALDPALLTVARAAAATAGRGGTTPTETGTSTATGTPDATGGTGTPTGSPTGADSGADSGSPTGADSGGTTTAPSGTTGATAPSGTAGGGPALVLPDTDRPTADAVQAATRWLASVRDGRQGRQMFVLPWGDPDLAALSWAGAGPMLDRARRLADSQVRDVLGGPAGTALAWPAGGAADEATLAMLARRRERTVVLDATDYPVDPPSGWTPTGAGRERTRSGTVTTLVYDPELSRAFAATGTADPVAGRQRLLAELAQITLERPYDQRHLLAAAPKDWDPDPGRVREALRALQVAPWVELAPIADLRRAAADLDLRREPGLPPSATRARLPRAHVDAVATALDRIRGFSPAMRSDTPVVQSLGVEALTLVAQPWRSTRKQTLADARAPLLRRIEQLYDGVQVEPGGQRNLLTSSGELPVRVVNSLPYRMRVVLELHPDSTALVAERSVPVDLEPRSQQSVRVPVRGIANDDVAVEARLRSPGDDGTVLSTATLEVRVRHKWESWGILGVSGLLGLMFVLGLFRGVRRGRTRMRPEDAPDLDVDLAHAEQSAGRQADQRAEPHDGSRARAETATTPGVMRSSAVMAAGTLTSRVLGTVRAVMLTWAIGAALSGDAFQVANTVPNALYMLLAGGVFNAVLVPQIVRASTRGAAGQEYVDRLITLAVCLLLVVATAVTIAAPIVVRIYAEPDWPVRTLALGIAFAFWCLPQVFFYGLYTLLGQVLNARGSFGPYMWAPVVNNVVGIVGLLAFVAAFGTGKRDPGTWTVPMIALLAGSATLGVVCQALVLIPVLRRSGFRWRPRRGFRGVGLRTASTVAAWTFAALLVSQLMFIVTTKVATYGGRVSQLLDPPLDRGLTTYSQAFLLFMLPHSLVTVSLATAFFTRMSAAAGEGRARDVRADLSLAVRTTGVATVLATAAVLVLGRDLTFVLFQGTGRSTTQGFAWVAAAMVLGLVPFSAHYIATRAFYAYEDARTPFVVQVVISTTWAVGNVLSALLLPADLIVVGVGLSMSVANTVGALLSFLLLRRRIGGVDGARVVGVHLRLTASAVVAGAGAWVVAGGVHAAAGDGRLASALALAAGLAVLAAGYAGALRVLRVAELDDLLTPLLARVRPRG